MNQPTLKDMLRHQQEVKSEAPSMDMGPIKSLFKDDEHLPHIDESQVGRIRLLMLMKRKFGAGFRSIPEVQAALDHHKRESEFLKLYHRTAEANRAKR